MYFEEALMVARQGVRVAKREWDRTALNYLYFGDSEDGSDDRIGFYIKMADDSGNWVHERLEHVASHLRVTDYSDEWDAIDVELEDLDFEAMRKAIREKVEVVTARRKLTEIEAQLKKLAARMEAAAKIEGR